jgi:aerobic-type carbon monoxide dehydrogenase small subunit (CoxS/CutS family)
MPEEAPKRTEEEPKSSISRREFLKDAGLIVGGATVGSMALINACGATTITAPGQTVTSTKTVTSTTTSTVAGPGGSVVTVTQPGTTVTTTVTAPAPTGAGLPAGTVTLKVNGKTAYVTVEDDWSLAHVLREKLGLFGLKVGCDRGECGSCTIVVDNKAVYSCCMLACEAEGKEILTIEGLSEGNNLHSVQRSFMENGAFNCGYCTPGHIMSAVALMKKTPKPTLDQAKEAISGNLCWCSDYKRICEAIVKAGG